MIQLGHKRISVCDSDMTLFSWAGERNHIGLISSGQILEYAEKAGKRGHRSALLLPEGPGVSLAFQFSLWTLIKHSITSFQYIFLLVFFIHLLSLYFPFGVCLKRQFHDILGPDYPLDVL